MRAALALCLFVVPAAAQTTWYVDVNGTPPGTGTLADPYTSIQYAATRPTTVYHDTLMVAPGTYVETVIVLDKSLRIRSSGGPEVTILRGANPGNIVKLDSNSVLDGFTVTGWLPGATTPIKSAVYLLDGWIENCIVRDNGGLALYGQYDTRLRRCTFMNNAFDVSVDTFTGMMWIDESILTSGFHAANGFSGVDATYTIAHFNNFPPSNFGPGNLELDPLLWDPTGSDAHLRPGSPAIDAGNPASPLDPDGSRRDIGALRYEASYAPAPLTYCTARVNSAGCTPSIASSGVASATSGSPCLVTCSNQLNQRTGFLFYGLAPRELPYQGGWLCVMSPTRRTPLQNSGGSSSGTDCSGNYAYDLNARIQSGLDPALVPGVFVYSQFWSRDPAATFASNRSNAVRLAITP
ncbi:MAG: hypothetical protein NTV21_04315 [Planctomycetota bacterium]|nr:hypothetical protein [Planctomycetota bacterium]